MAVCRSLFTDEEHDALVVRTIRVDKMSYSLNKTLQMCTVKIEIGLGYKSSQVRVKSKSISLKSKSKSFLFKSESKSKSSKIDVSLDSSPNPDSSTTSLWMSYISHRWKDWVGRCGVDAEPLPGKMIYHLRSMPYSFLSAMCEYFQRGWM